MSPHSPPWRALFDEADLPNVPPVCPRCGSTRVVPIVWGFPDHDVREFVERGQVEVGGCLLPEHPEEWICKACGRRGGGVRLGPR